MTALWSCDENKKLGCRNAHGCHCREIADLQAQVARQASVPYCLDPRPLCWRCGKGGELRAVEQVGWLCLDCSDGTVAAAAALSTSKGGGSND